jgi:beta-glucosidase
LFEDKTEPLAVIGDRLAEAKIVAEHSDIVVLIVGLDETLEGEEGDTGNSYASGDKESLLLPKSQQRLLEAIAETGKPVIMLMMTGSSMDLRFANEHYNAILQTWYPGARGGRSIAKLLFGEVSPSGKLPVTFYDDLDKMPEFTDYSMAGRTYRYMDYEAQYPFGFGLTYADVDVVSAEVSAYDKAAAQNTDTVCTVKAVLKNNSAVDTDEVVQVYLKNEDSAMAVPNAALCGFKRVFVAAGSEVAVEIPVKRLAFTVVDEAGERIMDGSKFTMYVGTSQPDTKSIALTGKTPVKLTITL